MMMMMKNKTRALNIKRNNWLALSDGYAACQAVVRPGIGQGPGIGCSHTLSCAMDDS